MSEENATPKQVATSVNSMHSFATQHQGRQQELIQAAYDAYKAAFLTELKKDSSAKNLGDLQLETRYPTKFNNLFSTLFTNITYSNPSKFALIEAALNEALIDWKLEASTNLLNQVIKHFDTGMQNLSAGSRILVTRVDALEMAEVAQTSTDEPITPRKKRTHKEKVQGLPDADPLHLKGE
jgi:hypothetical protein